MTYLEIIERAKKICNQSTEEDSGQWLDSLWLSILNDIHIDLVDDITAITTKDTTVKTIVDQEYVEIPSTIITPSMIYLDGNLMTYKNPKVLGMEMSKWVNLESGIPRYIYFMNGKIYFDRPSDAVYDMVFFGTKKVTNMSADQTTPFEGLPNLLPYSNVLLLGLVVEFCRDTGDYEKEAVFLTRFEKAKLNMNERIHAGVEKDGEVFQPLPLIYEDETY